MRGNISLRVIWILAMAGFAFVATSVNADMILVNDAPNADEAVRNYYTTPPYAGPVSQTFDLSTGGDSAAGLVGTLEVDSDGRWYEVGSIDQNFNDDYAGEINGAGNTATWTVTGYVPGTSVDVYATWRQQGNFSSSSPYVINGGTAINVDHRVAPAGDLVLDDPAGGTEDFQLLGTATADGSGQVQVVLTTGTTFTPVDAVAFVVPEPATLALLGLGGLAMLKRRRHA